MNRIDPTTIAIFITGAILCLMAGVCNGMMDTATFHYSASRMALWNPEYWNPAISWCHKWRDCQPGVEAFPFSSTLLVAVSDGWHLCKALYSTLLIIGSMAFFLLGIDLFGDNRRTLVHALLLPMFFAKIFTGIGFYLAYDWWLPLSSSVHTI